MRVSGQAGFTLVETLVALAILGAVAAAVLALISQNTRFAATAENRMLAGMLADNLMVEALAANAPLEQGSSETNIAFGGRQWSHAMTVTETGVERLVRIDVSVRDAAGRQTLASISTLKAER